MTAALAAIKTEQVDTGLTLDAGMAAATAQLANKPGRSVSFRSMMSTSDTLVRVLEQCKSAWIALCVCVADSFDEAQGGRVRVDGWIGG